MAKTDARGWKGCVRNDATATGEVLQRATAVRRGRWSRRARTGALATLLVGTGAAGAAMASASSAGIAWISASQSQALSQALVDWSEYYAHCGLEYEVQALGPALGDARRVVVRKLAPDLPKLRHPLTGQSLVVDQRPIGGATLDVNGVILPLGQDATGEWSVVVTPALVRWFLPNSFGLRVVDGAGAEMLAVNLDQQ